MKEIIMTLHSSDDAHNMCPLFPELENKNTTQANIPGIFSLDTNSILPKDVGSGTISESFNVLYTENASWNSTALRNSEFELHTKYPALQQAWEHYQNVLKMCRSREKETDENRL